MRMPGKAVLVTGGDTPGMRAKALASMPPDRFSTPEDLGNDAGCPCSDVAGIVTGAGMEVGSGRRN